jgi:hypothetical protein
VLPFPLSSARNGYPGTRMNTRTRVPVLIPGYPDPLCYPNSKKFFLMAFLQDRRNRCRRRASLKPSSVDALVFPSKNMPALD